LDALVIVGLAMSLGSPAPGQCTEVCLAIHTLTGEAGWDQFGWVSNCIGDVDGGGAIDFILTSPGNDAGGGDAGRAYVYSSETGLELYHVTGTVPGGKLGHDGNAAGDIDGGGQPDIIVGAPSAGTGHAIVYSSEGHGSQIQLLPGEANGDQFGYRVHGGGDFDGDGHPDVIVGAPQHDAAGSNAGRAYVYSGTDFSLICHMDGPTQNDLFGSGVSFVGDVTGDGRDDVVVGAPQAGPGAVGRAYVYSWNGASCQLEYQLGPSGGGIDFGLWFMNGGFDVNNDGTPDIYVNDYQANRAYVFSGIDGAQIWSLSGEGLGQFGIGRIVDDVDGDCYADMILAAWASSAGAANAGKAYVYSGRTGQILDTYTHNVPGAGFGFDANGLGDVNGDGEYDYLITAANALGAQGVAYVIAGEIAPPMTGDLNGDSIVGFADLLTLIAAWGPCPDPPSGCTADLNCDGLTGFGDALILIANWTT
jgi:hypothetical protein